MADNSPQSKARPFDALIGRLDRVLSELIEVAKHGKLDRYDTKTLEHHAEDMVGAGVQVLKLIGSKVPKFLTDRIAEVNGAGVKPAETFKDNAAPVNVFETVKDATEFGKKAQKDAVLDTADKQLRELQNVIDGAVALRRRLTVLKTEEAARFMTDEVKEADAVDGKLISIKPKAEVTVYLARSLARNPPGCVDWHPQRHTMTPPVYWWAMDGDTAWIKVDNPDLQPVTEHMRWFGARYAVPKEWMDNACTVKP